MTKYNTLDIYFHMRNHYRKILNAKPVVDTALCHLQEQHLCEVSPEPKKLTTKQIGVLRHAHYPYHSLGLTKHCCLSEEEGRPVTRRNPVDMPDASQNTDEEHIAGLTAHHHVGIAPIDAKGDAKTRGGSGVFSRAASPALSTDNASQTAKRAAEHEYLQFALRITEDIIKNDLYTNREIKRVFNSHIEANRGRLDQERMKKQIKDLALELNLPYNDVMTNVDTINADSVCFAFEPIVCECNRPETIAECDCESINNTPNSWEEPEPVRKCEGIETDREVKSCSENKRHRRGRHKPKHDRHKSRSSHKRECSCIEKNLHSTQKCTSAERHSCGLTQSAETETKLHKTDECRCNEMTTKSVDNPTRSKNRCHETIKRDDSASVHQCTSCQCDSPSVQSQATSNFHKSGDTISPTISNQLKHENSSGSDHQRRRNRKTSKLSKVVENSETSQGFPTPNRLSEITSDIRKLSLPEENNNTVKAEKMRESIKTEQSATDKFSARRKSRNRSSITQRKTSKTKLQQGSSLINKSSSKLKGRRKSEDKTRIEDSRSNHRSMSRQMSKSKSRSPYKPVRTVSSKTTGRRSSKSSSRVPSSAKAATSDVDDLSPTDQYKSDDGVNRSSDTVVSEPFLEKPTDRSSITHSISSKLRESPERSEKRFENQEKEAQQEQYHQHKSHNMSISDTQSDRSHKRKSNDSTNSNRKDGKKHHQHHHHHHRRKSKSSASDKAVCSCMDDIPKKQVSNISATPTPIKCCATDDDERSSVSTTPTNCRAILKRNPATSREKPIRCQAHLNREGSQPLVLHDRSNMTVDVVSQTQHMKNAALKSCSCGSPKISTHTSEMYSSLMRSHLNQNEGPIHVDSGYIILPGPIYVPHQAIGLVPPMMPYSPPGLKTIQVVPAIENNPVKINENKSPDKKTADKDNSTQTKTRKNMCLCPPRTPAKCNLRTCFEMTKRSRDDLLLSDDYDSEMPSNVSQFFPTIATQTTSSDFLMIDKILAARGDTRQKHTESTSSILLEHKKMSMGRRRPQDQSTELSDFDESTILIEDNSHDGKPSSLSSKKAEEERNSVDTEPDNPIYIAPARDQEAKKELMLIGPPDDEEKFKVEHPFAVFKQGSESNPLESSTKSRSMKNETELVGPEDEDAFENENEDVIVGISSELDDMEEFVDSDVDLQITRITTSTPQAHVTTSKHMASNRNIFVGNDDEDFMKKLDYKPKMSMTTSMQQRIKKVVHESEVFRHPEEKAAGWTSTADGIDLMGNVSLTSEEEEERNDVVDMSGFTHSKFSINDASKLKKLEDVTSVGANADSSGTVSSKT